MSFVFYDTETSGVDTRFDQILQFAAIKTDAYLNIIERFEIRSRLLPHIIPSPTALQITGISIGRLTQTNAPSHYDMVSAIKCKLEEWSNSIFLGYNSLRFDEELLRQALYQNLHPPYLTNSNGNCRNDLIHLVKMVAEFEPDCLQIPISADGKQVFKLDQLAPLNGFAHEYAHDALSDVEATIYLCKLISENAPEIWSRFLRYSKKVAVEEFLQEEEPFLLSEFYFGKAKHMPVFPIGKDSKDGNVTICLNLEHDIEKLRNLSDSEIANAVVTSIPTLGKPLRKAKANAGPNITSFDNVPDHILDEDSKEHFVATAEELNSDTNLKLRLVAAYEETKKEYETSPHIEEQIYEGFANYNDKILMERFHSLPWSERHKLCDHFEDPRYSFLARRLIFFNNPNDLSVEKQSEIRNHILSRVREGEYTEPKWTTLQKAKLECEAILSNNENTENEIVANYLKYLEHRLSQIA